MATPFRLSQTFSWSISEIKSPTFIGAAVYIDEKTVETFDPLNLKFLQTSVNKRSMYAFVKSAIRTILRFAFRP